MSRESVSSGSPLEPVLGFCRAVKTGPAIAVSGTAPMGTDGKTASVGDAAGQAKRCFEIIEGALKGLGAGLEHVTRTRIFLTNIKDWEAVGKVHGEYFGAIRPVTTFVEVSGFIREDWLVEIEADAWME